MWDACRRSLLVAATLWAAVVVAQVPVLLILRAGAGEVVFSVGFIAVSAVLGMALGRWYAARGDRAA